MSRCPGFIYLVNSINILNASFSFFGRSFRTLLIKIICLLYNYNTLVCTSILPLITL